METHQMLLFGIWQNKKLVHCTQDHLQIKELLQHGTNVYQAVPLPLYIFNKTHQNQFCRLNSTISFRPKLMDMESYNLNNTAWSPSWNDFECHIGQVIQKKRTLNQINDVITDKDIQSLYILMQRLCLARSNIDTDVRETVQVKHFINPKPNMTYNRRLGKGYSREEKAFVSGCKNEFHGNTYRPISDIEFSFVQKTEIQSEVWKEAQEEMNEVKKGRPSDYAVLDWINFKRNKTWIHRIQSMKETIMDWSFPIVDGLENDKIAAAENEIKDEIRMLFDQLIAIQKEKNQVQNTGRADLIGANFCPLLADILDIQISSLDITDCTDSDLSWDGTWSSD